MKLRIPQPQSVEELELLTLWYFGKALHLSELGWIQWDTEKGIYSASYEVSESYKSYHGKGFAYSEGSCDGYNSSRDFWDAVIGNRYCGGIASRSYGQTKDYGYRRYKRLQRLQENMRGKRSSAPRAVFVRLAANVGGGERARIRDRRQVTYGRGDAA